MEYAAKNKAAPIPHSDDIRTYYHDRPPDPPTKEDSTNAAIIMVISSLGMIANFSVLILILGLSKLRRVSNAFLFHHCLLDFLKSAFCLIFAQSMLAEDRPAYCSILGGSYVVFVTTSSFNMLAMVMNEAYQFTDLMLGIKDSRNYCCVSFGIFIIWFSSIIMNLGVTFIPGNPNYDQDTGLCVFIYGVRRNYVLHLLWIIMISLAIALTAAYLHKLHTDVKRASYYRLSTLIRATVSINPKVTTASQRKRSEHFERHHLKHVQSITRRKLFLLILLTALFVVFWYPLFVVTAFDYHEDISRSAYKALNIFAWTNPTVNPLVLTFVMNTQNCCFPDEDSVDIYGDKIQAGDAVPDHSAHPATYYTQEREMGTQEERTSLNSHL